jgi:hypothetical protein
MAMSAATIDRRLKLFRKGREAQTTGIAVNRGKATVSIRTFSDWDDPAPGFF